MYLGSVEQIQLICGSKKFHGLSGKHSNHSKPMAQEAFRKYVERNSAPNGRTPDKHGRSHGPTMFLDAMFEILIHADKYDKGFSFANEFVTAMKTVDYFIDNSNDVISPRTAETLLNEIFVKRCVVQGKLMYNPLYTVKYPH